MQSQDGSTKSPTPSPGSVPFAFCSVSLKSYHSHLEGGNADQQAEAVKEEISNWGKQMLDPPDCFTLPKPMTLGPMAWLYEGVQVHRASHRCLLLPRFLRRRRSSNSKAQTMTVVGSGVLNRFASYTGHAPRD